MNDPDRNHDTEPAGAPTDSGEGPDAAADDAAQANDVSRADVAGGPGAHDTDDFMRWLPTLALGHRRRAELVERPTSDGADFAAYACEGRPATASGQPRLEAAVKVHAARASKDLERDAPTVLTGERRARRRWRKLGWVVLGAGAAGAVFMAWPVTTEKAVRHAEAVATPPLPVASPRTPLAGPAEPMAAPVTAESQGVPSGTVRTAADRRALFASAPAAEALRKKDSTGAPKTLPSSARGRAAPMGAGPTVAAKDQYFEAP